MEEKEKEIERLQNRIAVLRKKIAILEEKQPDDYFDRGLYSVICDLRNEIFKLQRKILVVKGPIYTNGILDLYLEEGSKVGIFENYNIALAGTERFIGSVRVVYDDMRNNMYGNIGYGLNRDFQGHGYMLQALEILREPMLQKGLERPILTVEPDNKPSVRTIEKFGGKKLENDDWYDIYEVDLTEKGSKGKK